MTKAALRTALDKVLLRKQWKTLENDFLSVVDTIIYERESGVELTKEGKVFAEKTIREYKHSRDNLLYYEIDTGEALRFDTAGPVVYDKLKSYFSIQRNHAINTLGKHLKNYCVFVRAAYARGVHNNDIFDREKMSVPSEETPDIFLSETELDKMADLRLTGTELLARDWFLVEAFTGLRVSDAKRLASQNLQTDRITISNEKTDEKVVLPVHRHLRAVFNRWSGAPRPLSEQKINKHIKDVARKAEITERVLYTVTKGGKRHDEYFEKCEMVSNHTGRRAFITNLIRAGVPETIIMKLTGIKKYATLQRYNKLSAEETADVAAGLEFFKS